MRDKLFNYGILTGLTISLIGFVLLKTDLLTANYSNVVQFSYKLTLITSIIFILTKSTFVSEKFNQILKVTGVIFLTMIGINLLKEFNIYEIRSVVIISYVLFCSLFIMYLSFFLKKTEKKQLDFLKLGFLTLAFAGGFIKLFDLFPNNLEYVTTGLFWIVIIGMVFYNFGNEKKVLRA